MLRRIIKSLIAIVRPRFISPAPPLHEPVADPIDEAPRPQGIARLHDLDEKLLAVLRCALRPDEQGPPKKRPRLRGRWKKDIPVLARACADYIPVAPDLFPALPISPEGLRDLEQEVRLLGYMVAKVRRVLGHFEDLLATRKAELCTHTNEIVGQVRGLASAPLLTEEQKERVRTVATPILGHVKERNAKVRKVREHRRQVRARIDSEVAENKEELLRTEIENHVLRGGSIKDVLQR